MAVYKHNGRESRFISGFTLLVRKDWVGTWHAQTTWAQLSRALVKPDRVMCCLLVSSGSRKARDLTDMQAPIYGVCPVYVYIYIWQCCPSDYLLLYVCTYNSLNQS